MTEADSRKIALAQALEILADSNLHLDVLEQSLTETGADLNQLKSHIEESLRRVLSSISALRDGIQQTSTVVRGVTNPEVSYAMLLLTKAEQDLEDMVVAVNKMKQWTTDMQLGPYRTSSEERPKIRGKVASAITRIRAYYNAL